MITNEFIECSLLSVEFHRRMCVLEVAIQRIFIVDITNKQRSFSKCFLKINLRSWMEFTVVERVVSSTAAMTMTTAFSGT